MQFQKIMWLVATVALLASCSTSKKGTGKVVVVDSKSVRIGSQTKKDNGLHKGWYKNSNNPHHPNTTNPGHTKKKAKGKKK